MTAAWAGTFVLDDPLARERESHETFLYQHLSVAARARMAMERAPTFADFLDLDHARKAAIHEATRHYRWLLNAGGAMDPLLARMALAEKLTP